MHLTPKIVAVGLMMLAASASGFYLAHAATDTERPSAISLSCPAPMPTPSSAPAREELRPSALPPVEAQCPVAQVAPVANSPTTTELLLRNELTDLRQRLEVAEQTAAQAQTLTERVQQLTNELDVVRRELTDSREAEDDHEARREARRASVADLINVQQRLAEGDTEGADETLAAALLTAGPAARLEIEAARSALSNEDLSSARERLLSAVAASREK